MDFEYVKVIKSDLDDIDEAVSFILGKLSSVIRDEDLMFNIRIVINEIVINSYEHGNKCNKEKGINLKVCVNMDCIHINVKDEGDGINYIFNENKDINTTTSGRGLRIVKHLVDELEINNNEISAKIKCERMTFRNQFYKLVSFFIEFFIKSDII